MKRKFVVGNWKMNGDSVRNAPLLGRLANGLPAAVDVAVCVPFPYLAQAQQSLCDARVALGAQNVSEHASGAFTGEVSAAMLSDFGVRYVIVGHSERRALFGESDALVARKASIALQAGIIPICCIGETLEERDKGAVEVVLRRQLDAFAECLTAEQLARIVIAYEPVWAIGTGRAASPEQVQEVLGFIRGWLGGLVVEPSRVSVLYGGSVKPETADALFALPDCDGGLIGAASLDADAFLEICKAASAVSHLGLN